MPKVFTSEKQKTGETGENIVVKFLVKHGFTILDRNYTKKWGELDIVAEKERKIHFIEVKSVSHEIPEDVPSFVKSQDPRHETYRPEENMHPQKIKRMARTIQTYLLSKKIPEDMEWQVDLFLVYLDMKNKKARVKVVQDLIL